MPEKGRIVPPPEEQPVIDDRSWWKRHSAEVVVGAAVTGMVAGVIYVGAQFASGPGEEVPEPDKIELPGKTYAEIEDDVLGRNPTETRYLTNIDPAILLHPDEAGDIEVERVEVKFTGCEFLSGQFYNSRTVPSLLLRHKDGIGSEEYVPFNPTELHKEVLAELRTKYLKSLQSSAEVPKTPEPISGDSLYSIYTRLGSAVCGVQPGISPVEPQLTSHRTVIAESAGPEIPGYSGTDKKTIAVIAAIAALVIWGKNGFKIPGLG